MFRFAGDPVRKAQYSHGNHRLEMLWTVVPGIILFLLAVLQINVWADIKYPSHMADDGRGDPSTHPADGSHDPAVGIPRPLSQPRAPGRRGRRQDRQAAVKEYQRRLPERRDDVFDVNNVHTWKGQKTVVFLRTRDVGHAFFVPVLRVKQDSMPGRTIPLWFEATESNTEKVAATTSGGAGRADGNEDPAYVWDLVCTQYCGSRHSMMRGQVFVHPTKDDFLAWLRTQQKAVHRRRPARPPSNDLSKPTRSGGWAPEERCHERQPTPRHGPRPRSRPPRAGLPPQVHLLRRSQDHRHSVPVLGDHLPAASAASWPCWCASSSAGRTRKSRSSASGSGPAAAGDKMPPDFYNMLFSMHASVMIFFVIIPLLTGGFGNFLIPLHDRRAGHGVPEAEHDVVLVHVAGLHLSSCSASSSTAGRRPAAGPPIRRSPASPCRPARASHRRPRRTPAGARSSG